MQLPGYDRQLDVVAVAPDGVIAAYVNGWIDPLNRVGDFGPAGALPAYRRLGLTRTALRYGAAPYVRKSSKLSCRMVANSAPGYAPRNSLRVARRISPLCHLNS